MSAELLKDLTVFDAISDLQLQLAVKNAGADKKCKTCQKINNPKPPAKKGRASQSQQNENKIPDKTEAKKPRASKTGERKPLGLVNAKAKTTKKDDVSPKKTAAPERKSRSLKPMPSPTQKATKKERQSLPKIVVYHDSPAKPKVQKRDSKNRLSKSLDGSTAKGTPKSRLSTAEKQKSQSYNDLPSANSPNAKPKSQGKKSTGKAATRLPKFKEGQPQFEEMMSKLESLFPNVDPEFMRSQFVKLKGSLPQTVEFMIIKEKTNELPTKMEYVRRREAERLHNKFMESFSVENFLKMIPDPWEYFLKTEKHNSANYLGHSLHYLKNKYKKHYVQAIHAALAKCGNSLYLADKELKKRNRQLKMRSTNRSKYECNAGRPTTFDIQFVHEVAFIENESKIKAYIKKAETTRYKKFKEAEKEGTLLECQSCNDVALLQDDTVNCPANHVFCKDCVVKYVQIEMKKNNFQFKCLMKCEERFSMESLQAVLSPFVMAKIIKRNQLEEIKSAEIDDLVYCPFCYYVAIMPPEITVFRCLNPSCMIESCRYCKQFNHIPLKCQELEKFDKTILEVEVQQEEEEKHLPEKCQVCNGEFVPIKDSNQMVCSCGATICRICRQPFPECQHFKAVPEHRLSVSSDDVEYVETDSHTAEDTAEDTAEEESADRQLDKSSENESVEKFMDFIPSESDVF